MWNKFFGGGANVSGYGGFLLVGGQQNSNNGLIYIDVERIFSNVGRGRMRWRGRGMALTNILFIFASLYTALILYNIK